jgi:hypothetical protein
VNSILKKGKLGLKTRQKLGSEKIRVHAQKPSAKNEMYETLEEVVTDRGTFCYRQNTLYKIPSIPFLNNSE